MFIFPCIIRNNDLKVRKRFLREGSDEQEKIYCILRGVNIKKWRKENDL